MATINGIPVQTTRQIWGVPYSASSMVSNAGGNFKIIPLNADGTVYDCTGYNTAVADIMAKPPGPFPNLVSTTLLVVSADATGIVLTFDPAEVNNIAQGLGAPGIFNGAITIGDGTDLLMAAQLTLQCLVV